MVKKENLDRLSKTAKDLKDQAYRLGKEAKTLMEKASQNVNKEKLGRGIEKTSKGLD